MTLEGLRALGVLQMLRFREDADLATVLARQRKSNLQAYFELKARDPAACDLLYHDIPSRYVFNKSTRTWNPKAHKNEAVGRMISATPAQGERFFLRLLLTQVKGAMSFQELRKVGVRFISANLLYSTISVGECLTLEWVGPVNSF